MITFQFRQTKNQYSPDQLQQAKDDFITYIGDVKKDFDDNDVFVEVNMDAKEYENKYVFTSNKTMPHELIVKVEEYRKSILQ